LSVESGASVTAKGSEQGHQARFWADEEADLLATDRQHVIRDSKTPSGAVPISGLRGPIITDALYRTFKKRGLRIRYVFTIDDYDPMDSQSLKEKAAWAEHMGKPFAHIPSPEPSVASDFARYHASAFLETFATLGIRPEEIHWMRHLYGEGQLDKQIDLVLRNAAVIREIYERVSHVTKDERWLPIGVICENCGRLGTTFAYDYDGKTVAYECRKDYVEWAEGCGHTGRRSPFKGNAKLYWNLQWCAMWDYFGVTYEEGGKDLLTAGGSRDRANEIYRAVWKKEPPIGLVHEFVTIEGKKMSTSKGLGTAATDLVAVYPPELIRFLMLHTHPKRHIEFDPGGMTLPKLVDEYDRAGDAFINDPDSDLAKIWALSQVDEEPVVPGFRVRFALLANWLQIPSIQPESEAETRKGAPLTPAELGELRTRLALAKEWLLRWAPVDAKFAIAQQLPPAVHELSRLQREFLFFWLATKFADELMRSSFDYDLLWVADLNRLRNQIAHGIRPIDETSADELQDWTYELSQHLQLQSRDAFAAIYKAFIGRPNGPRIGNLLKSLPSDFVRRRFKDAVRAA
jgi:lysyl-tRNA synthetase, class I